jgi:hypothetical protein
MENYDTIIFSKMFKDKIMEIPDDINDEKFIIKYIKDTIKEISEEKKAKNSKKKKIYPQTEYQKFIKNNRKRVREENPTLSKSECMSLLIKEWKLNKTNNIKIKNNKITTYSLRTILLYLMFMIF